MGGRPPTHVVAALLLVALGVGIGVNWLLAIMPGSAYEAVMRDAAARSMPGASPEIVDVLIRTSLRFMRAAAVVALIGTVVHIVIGGFVAARRSWARIAGLVLATVGLYGAAQTIALPIVAPGWAVPLPLFAGLDAQLAVRRSPRW